VGYHWMCQTMAGILNLTTYTLTPRNISYDFLYELDIKLLY